MDDVVSTLFNLLIIALLLFANAFFVASEFAMVKVRKTRMTQLMEEGNFDAKIAMDAIKDLDKFIAAVQLGITISSIGLGWVGEATLARIIEPLFEFLPNGYQLAATHTVAITIAFALITFLHVVIGELMPKSVALEFPEKTALLVAKPMKFISFIFTPFIWLLNGVGNGILSLLKIPHSHKGPLVHSVEELDMLVNASFQEGVLNETEHEILHNAFKFSDLTAKQVLIPRTDMVCVSSDIPYDELKNIVCENQYTRYPVYDEDIDHIIGLIHAKDILALTANNLDFSLKKLLRPILFVPETMTMDNLVMEFKRRHSQMALVVDEFGGTAGIITLEDVLEEIVGEVQDEFDEEEVDIKQIEPDIYIANAMMRLDEFTEFFETDEIEDEDVETIGGFVMKLIGRIAKVGDSADFGEFSFRVQEIDGTRITKLVIKRTPVHAENAEA